MSSGGGGNWAAMQPLTASTPLKYQEDNPKQEGSASYARYEAYKGAQTLEAFLRCGGTLGDLRHDEKKKYVEVNDAGIRMICHD